MQDGISPPKCNCWTKDRVIYPRQTNHPPAHHQTVTRSCEHHYLEFLIQVKMTETKHRRDGWVWEGSRANIRGCGVPNMSNRLPNLGLNFIHIRVYPAGRDGRATQIGTKFKERILPWTPLITHRFSGINIKHQNWANPPPAYDPH